MPIGNFCKERYRCIQNKSEKKNVNFTDAQSIII